MLAYIAVDNLCEYSIRNMFRQKFQLDLHREIIREVNDIIINIEDDIAVWSTLQTDPQFAATLRARVHTCYPTMDLRSLHVPTTGKAQLTLDIINTVLHSFFVMPPSSVGGGRPNYQAQLIAPNCDPMAKLKDDLQHPMLK